MNFRMASASVAVLALVAGCGSDSNVTLGGSNAKGSVGGVVLEAGVGFAPLSGAMVTVIAGGATFNTMTDMNGTFGVQNVPSGSVVVKISASDHFDAFVTGSLASSAGNFPVANASLTVGPIALVSSKGAIAMRLVDQKGAAAPMVKVTVRSTVSYLDLSQGGVAARGATESGGTSGADGLVTINGLPDFATIGQILPDNLTVNIPPQKLAGADGYQFLGLTFNVSAANFGAGFNFQQTPTVVLAGPHSPLNVLASNIDWYITGAPGPVGSQVAGPVTVAFNQAISAASIKTQLLTENGSVAAAMPMNMVTGNLLTVSFSKPLDPGTRYNLVLHADSTYSDQAHEFNLTGPFFVPQAMGTAVTVSPTSRIDPINSNDFDLVFTEPVGLGNGRGDQIPCVVFYDTSLDGNPQVISPGEWTPGGNNMLECETNGAHAGLYLRPAEPYFGAPGGSPNTGFSSVWHLFVRPPYTCTNFMQYMCNTSGVTVHLVFSRNSDPLFVMKRSNGAPVADITFTLPAF